MASFSSSWLTNLWLRRPFSRATTPAPDYHNVNPIYVRVFGPEMYRLIVTCIPSTVLLYQSRHSSRPSLLILVRSQWICHSCLCPSGRGCQSLMQWSQLELVLTPGCAGMTEGSMCAAQVVC